MSEFYDRPCAGQGLTSYRYRFRNSWIMIGAYDTEDALREAKRSHRDANNIQDLQVWCEGSSQYVAVSPTAAPTTLQTVFTFADVNHQGKFPRIILEDFRKQLTERRLPWQEQGLQETATGYGKRLNSGYMIDFEGRLRRVYITQYTNAGTAWFHYRGQKIIIVG